MKCPVCDSELNSSPCGCGYDASRDYALHPTFGPVRGAASVSGLRQLRDPKNALRCENCGGTAFTIRIPDGVRLCRSYFAVRLDSGALMCPLCSRELPLDRFLERVGRNPEPATPPSPVTEPKKTAPAPAYKKEEVPPLFSTAKPAESQPKSSLLDRYGKKSPPAEPPVRYPESAAQKKPLPVITAVAAGENHTVVLYSDGTVGAVGSTHYQQCDVSAWRNIVAIAAGAYHTVGLTKDGTVVAVGRNTSKQCKVDGWTGVTAIAAGDNYTVGLKKDGSCLIAGADCGNRWNIPRLKKVTAIAAGADHFTMLLDDGTVASTHTNTVIKKQLENWSRICAIAAGREHIIGLHGNWTPVAVGSKTHDKCNVAKWTNIQAIAAGSHHTVGLKKDGTLITAGDNQNGQCDVAKLIKH